MLITYMSITHHDIQVHLKCLSQFTQRYISSVLNTLEVLDVNPPIICRPLWKIRVCVYLHYWQLGSVGSCPDWRRLLGISAQETVLLFHCSCWRKVNRSWTWVYIYVRGKELKWHRIFSVKHQGVCWKIDLADPAFFETLISGWFSDNKTLTKTSLVKNIN